MALRLLVTRREGNDRAKKPARDNKLHQARVMSVDCLAGLGYVAASSLAITGQGT
jgi:hypothetical protein